MVVCGTIGTLQALEAMKIITNIKGVLSQRLLLFDGAETTFRNVKLRPRNVNCAVCGDNPTIKVLIDYEQFCGSKANDKVENIDILSTNEHVHVKDLFANNMDKIIIDVRPPIEYRMCRLPDTINVPYEDIVKGKRVQELEEFLQNKKSSCGNLERYCLYMLSNMLIYSLRLVQKRKQFAKGGRLLEEEIFEREFYQRLWRSV